MGGRKAKPDLSTLPQHIVKKNRNWWWNSKTQKFIHNSNITDHLPKPKPETESWTNKYDNY